MKLNRWNASEDAAMAMATSIEFEKPLTVETTDNHVYFYAEVNSDRCLALLKEIRYLDRDLRNERLSCSLPEDFPLTPIWLHIYSGGGSVFAGLSTADQLATITTPIFSVVEGYCASAATLISMACTKRFITPSSFMLIHQIWSIAWGSYEALKDELHLQDMIMIRLKSFYAQCSKLTEKDIEALLKRDSWFSAEQCIERGLADEVFDHRM